MPPKPFISMKIAPRGLTPAQKATLQWEVAGTGVVSLNGLAVAGSGTQPIAPDDAATYTLMVSLPDDADQDFRFEVTVQKPSPDPQPTRPPTVTLTPENIARLRTFPRPANDNGRGLHFCIDLRDANIAWTVDNLLSINARWTLIYAQDENQISRAARACWNAGIMPVVRIGKKINEGFDPVPYVNALKAIGAPPYVQIFNEPSDDREWRGDDLPENWLGIFGRNWAGQAARVFDAGGYPGLQVLEKEELDAAIDAVAAQGRTDLWQRAFFCTHNYGANHPPNYPYDLGKTVFDDFYMVLSFLAFAKWMQERIGFVLPIIGGEGGWQWGSDQDRRYPKVDAALHAQYHKEMFEWFRTRLLANGEALPDYLFSIAPWIASGWGADDWWGGVLGTKTQTIAAVQSIPAFVRKFSWDLP